MANDNGKLPWFKSVPKRPMGTGKVALAKVFQGVQVTPMFSGPHPKAKTSMCDVGTIENTLFPTIEDDRERLEDDDSLSKPSCASK